MAVGEEEDWVTGIVIITTERHWTITARDMSHMTQGPSQRVVHNCLKRKR